VCAKLKLPFPILSQLESELKAITEEHNSKLIEMTQEIDDDVRELLSKFVIQIKKMHRTPHPIENRVIWLVNSIT